MLAFRPILPNGTYAQQFSCLKYSVGYDIAMAFGSGLTTLGIGVESPLGVCSHGCCTWVHAITASCLYGFAISALAEGLGNCSMDFQIRHSRMTAILVSQKAIRKLIEVLKTDKHFVGHVILIDSEKAGQYKEEIESLGIEFRTFDDICDRGHTNPVPLPKFGPESAHFYSYSSGTTGVPKAVIISHRSSVSSLIGNRSYLGRTEFVRHIAFLPYAHIFERIATAVILSVGGLIATVSGSVTNLTEDIRLFRPTVLCSVPRIYRRFYDGIHANLNHANPIVRGVFWTSYYAKRFCQGRGWPVEIFDVLSFRAVQRVFGGAFTELVTAGAAFEPLLHEFFQVVFGVPIRNGYGLTESGSGVICSPDDVCLSRPGLTGGPLVTAEVKIDPIPDYDDPDCGEILLGGEGMCSGYLYDEEATNALFVDENKRMIRTGDIGKFDNGYIRIVDRCRSIFKLSQGEYVAAEMVTQAYEDAKFISQLFVYGDSTKTYLIDIVVPKRNAVAQFLGKPSIGDDEYTDACQLETLRRAIMSEMSALAIAKGLLEFQRVRAIYVDSRAWTPDNNLLTPTFKIRRRALSEYYRQQIDDLYRQPAPL
jgi:long-chain acyl-CoA synthetase